MSSYSRTGTTASPPSHPRDLERTTARYLFAVSTLSEAGGDRVATGEIQASLDVAAASVTEMVGKLDERGLVDYEKYQGVRLTGRGAAVASRVAWRVCVVASFFESVLDAPLDEETAFDVGFALPEEGVRRLRERLETPCLDVCPESGAHETGRPA
jgi:Mn-dependent DtxR family transcriptional regulator